MRAEPETAEPETAEPETAEPELAERGNAEREIAEPGNAERKMASVILGYLADRPDGAKLAELQARLRTPRMALVGILNEMIADKRVRKDEELRLYFATV